MCNFTSSRTAAPELKDSKTCSVFSVSQLYRKDSKFSDTRQFMCKPKCCRSCSFCEKAITKERCKLVIVPNYKEKLKYVKNAFCVDHLSFATTEQNAKLVVQNLPVGARLQNFWQTWLDLGAGPKVIQILREGYTLPFRIHPKLTRSPTVISRYVNPHRNKNKVELVQNQKNLRAFSTDYF